MTTKSGEGIELPALVIDLNRDIPQSQVWKELLEIREQQMREVLASNAELRGEIIMLRKSESWDESKLKLRVKELEGEVERLNNTSVHIKSMNALLDHCKELKEEIERLKFLITILESQAKKAEDALGAHNNGLSSMLDRESASTARYGAKIDKLEADNLTLRQLLKEYRGSQGVHAMCYERVAGLMHGTVIDDRCSICRKHDALEGK